MLTRRQLTALLAATTTVAVIAVPAGAQDSVEVEFTIQAAAGGLSVTSASNAAVIDNGGSNPLFDVLTGATITDTLPAITLTDTRGSLLGGWDVSVVGEAFLNTADADVAVPAANARVYNNVADLTALRTSLSGLLSGVVIDGGEYLNSGNNLGGVYSLISGTTTLGNGSVTVTPTIAVTVPANTPAGTYTGTVTYTLS